MASLNAVASRSPTQSVHNISVKSGAPQGEPVDVLEASAGRGAPKALPDAVRRDGVQGSGAQLQPTPPMRLPPYFNSNVTAERQEHVRADVTEQNIHRRLPKLFDGLADRHWRHNATYRAVIDYLVSENVAGHGYVDLGHNLLLTRHGFAYRATFDRRYPVLCNPCAEDGCFDETPTLSRDVLLTPAQAKSHDQCLQSAYWDMSALRAAGIERKLAALGSNLEIRFDLQTQSQWRMFLAAQSAREAGHMLLCLPLELCVLPLRLFNPKEFCLSNLGAPVRTRADDARYWNQIVQHEMSRPRLQQLDG